MTLPARPQLGRLAYERLDQDWDLVDPDPDVIVRRFAHHQGRAVTRTMIDEIDGVLASELSDNELEEWWLYTLRSQFEPWKVGMTYRQWFEHLRALLQESTPAGS